MSSLYPREDCPGQNSGNVRCSCLSYEVMSDRGLEGSPGPESSLAQRHLQRCHGRLAPVALAGPHVTKKRVRALPGLDRVSHACVLRFLATTHNAFHFQRPERLHAFKGGGVYRTGRTCRRNFTTRLQLVSVFLKVQSWSVRTFSGGGTVLWTFNAIAIIQSKSSPSVLTDRLPVSLDDCRRSLYPRHFAMPCMIFCSLASEST